MQIQQPDLSQYDVLKDLPWLEKVYAGNTVYAYLLTVITFVVIWILLHIARRFLVARLQVKKDARPHSALVVLHDMMSHLSPGIFPLVALYLASKRLELSAVTERTIKVAALVAVTYQVVRIVTEVAVFVLLHARGARNDDPIVRSTNQNLVTLTRIVLWTGGVLFLLDNLGFNVSAFITGLGISGIAVALAAQAILGDTFSSFAIALDKPFEVGDFIVVDDLMGNVEHIGLKTTRVRSAGGELLIFANSDLTKSRIRNYKRMFQRRAEFKVMVSHSTPEDKLAHVAALLRAIVEAQPDVKFDRAHLATIAETALVFEVVYFVLKPDFNLFMDTQQAINLRILADFAANDVKLHTPPLSPFAPPTKLKGK
jgi:small-conductance mechanosensitive channel